MKVKIDTLDQTLEFETDYIEKGLNGFLNVSLNICQLARFLQAWVDNESDTYFTVEPLGLYYNNDYFDSRNIIGIQKNGKWLIFGCCFYD